MTMTTSTAWSTNRTEADIRRACDRKLREAGGYVVYVNADERGRAGAPDRVYCYKGRFIGVEYKRSADQKPTKLQEEHIEQIFKAGGIGIVAYSWEHIQPYLDIIDREVSGNIWRY